MFCKHCGKQLKVDAKYCTGCGKPIGNANEPKLGVVVETNYPVVRKVQGSSIFILVISLPAAALCFWLNIWIGTWLNILGGLLILLFFVTLFRIKGDYYEVSCPNCNAEHLFPVKGNGLYCSCGAILTLDNDIIRAEIKKKKQ